MLMFLMKLACYILQLIYEDEAAEWTSWTYSAFYDPTDHNDHQEVDPRYTQAAITRYMSRVSNSFLVHILKALNSFEDYGNPELF